MAGAAPRPTVGSRSRSRGQNEYALAGEIAGFVEWVEVTGPQGVRDHLASIGSALAARYG